MHVISSYRGNKPTNKYTHKQTGPITIHCAAKLSAQCNECTEHLPIWTLSEMWPNNFIDATMLI